ncbi:hypothetical protein [Pedobacter changchengzhani]|uniref:hypothetical protein n=1 Tax=Pedobacter changchengzhani TaxID=2529274 RepID=UPI001405521C|nr:hypothetical protein [Pedobacter changchengzhani]
MVDSACISVEAFHINKKQNWELKEYDQLQQELSFVNFGLEISLAEIYNNVDFQD